MKERVKLGNESPVRKFSNFYYACIFFFFILKIFEYFVRQCVETSHSFDLPAGNKAGSTQFICVIKT